MACFGGIFFANMGVGVVRINFIANRICELETLRSAIWSTKACT